MTTQSESVLPPDQILDALDGIAFVVEAPIDHPFPGRFISVSNRIRTLGYEPQALVTDPSMGRRILHPDDIAAFTRATEEMCQTHQPGHRQYRIRHGVTGAYHWLEDSVVSETSDDGRTVRIVGVARDVTDVKVLQGALRRAQERYRRLFDDSLVANCVCAPTGHLVACNAALAGLLGFDAVDELPVDDWRALWVDASHHQLLFDRVREERRIDWEVIYLRHRQGHPLRLITNLIGSFDNHGRLVEVHAQLFHDAGRYGLDQQLRHAQKMEAMGRLAGGLADDLSALVTTFTCTAGQLIDQTGVPQAGQAADQLARATTGAAALIRQLQAFGRRQALEPQPSDMNALFDSLRDRLTVTLGQDIALDYSLDRDLWPTMLDEGAFEQAVLQLARNAREAMPRGGGLIIATRNVTLTGDEGGTALRVRPGPYVQCAITDTGPGMPEDIRAQVFEPIFTTKRDRGTGLGLASVYGFVKQSGGYVWVDSALGRGTTFTLQFPRRSR